MCVGFPYSPQSLTDVSSWGFVRLPPSCNSNYLGYICLLSGGLFQHQGPVYVTLPAAFLFQHFCP
ncbi:hypothetical protein D5073_15810 [Pectobacterium versatile]|nr:hypothetical protein D5073_15810 [Pectobacterium versatile]RJL56902.1 hypothetical protein D5080_21285 [Pectobacterium versatile]RJL62973.1 hypothetical protein D5076_02320 [Pectobacterium versatile]